MSRAFLTVLDRLFPLQHSEQLQGVVEWGSLHRVSRVDLGGNESPQSNANSRSGIRVNLVTHDLWSLVFLFPKSSNGRGQPLALLVGLCIVATRFYRYLAKGRGVCRGVSFGLFTPEELTRFAVEAVATG